MWRYGPVRIAARRAVSRLTRSTATPSGADHHGIQWNAKGDDARSNDRAIAHAARTDSDAVRSLIDPHARRHVAREQVANQRVAPGGEVHVGELSLDSSARVGRGAAAEQL